MKLFRHGPAGAERAGAVDAAGCLRDLWPLVPDLTPDWLSPVALAAIGAIDLTRMPAVAPDTRIGAPVAGTRQFIAIGLNYHRHAAESGAEVPTEPVVFNKAITCIQGPSDDVVLPAGSATLDWEAELAVVIGSVARNVSKADALGHVAGYCLTNDVSERSWQLFRNGQWMKGKSFDTFGPLGPFLVTTDEVPDPQTLPLRLAVNGEGRQDGHTSDMIFPVAELVSYVSRFMTLLPGDVIATGTPDGVGGARKPPQFLGRGDVVTLDGGILGTQRQRIV